LHPGRLGSLGFSPGVARVRTGWHFVPFSTLRVKDRLLGKLYTECGANGTIHTLA
jgi:hypothetical protein